ncbi:MAG TPA: class I SAM-dependent methyltransferase [Candidatus Parcubacteria bacterium]|nr:class I SAM-dependent methyltransferase [Candidatus Parcubacteria bacterium]
MPGKYDKRNKLNNLTGKDWLKSTKSYWVSEKCKDDKFAFQHPAPFLIKDIERLILFFTKKKNKVLDPFSGTATTLVASHNTNRRGFGIDLSQEYCSMARKRFKELKIKSNQKIIKGDSLKQISKIKGTIDYCVTSPPYHDILKNNGQGIREKKSSHRSGSRKGIKYYSDHKDDLGNQQTYEDFLVLLQKIMKEVFKKLKKGKYCSIVISDFTVDKMEKNVQGDVVKIMEEIGFNFVGTIILLQDSKPLYPFGYPFSFVINHHHQNIINFRKPK